MRNGIRGAPTALVSRLRRIWPEPRPNCFTRGILITLSGSVLFASGADRTRCPNRRGGAGGHPSIHTKQKRNRSSPESNRSSRRWLRPRKRPTRQATRTGQHRWAEWLRKQIQESAPDGPADAQICQGRAPHRNSVCARFPPTKPTARSGATARRSRVHGIGRGGRCPFTPPGLCAEGGSAAGFGGFRGGTGRSYSDGGGGGRTLEADSTCGDESHGRGVAPAGSTAFDPSIAVGLPSPPFVCSTCPRAIWGPPSFHSACPAAPPAGFDRDPTLPSLSMSKPSALASSAASAIESTARTPLRPSPSVLIPAISLRVRWQNWGLRPLNQTIDPLEELPSSRPRSLTDPDPELRPRSREQPGS